MNTLNIAESIFFTALEKETPEARTVYLDEACKGDAKMRRYIERMLNAHPKLDGFLQQSPDPRVDEGPATLAPPPIEESPGTIIGPYKLLQQLGEGGFGVVFMAEQEKPVRRKVALKIIKPGMDSKQVVARFEAERQALALMDHPNIARVFDGGTTDSGRPYFVMELVKGMPITEFCDKNRLTPRATAGTFYPSLPGRPARASEGDHPPRHQAVQRADYDVRRQAGAQGDRLRHRQGHRGKADRANALHRLRASHRYPGIHEPRTGDAQRPGCRYPRRVYALGVLLYELLTGTTPLNKERMDGVAFMEMLRLIREEEPPKPSTRLSQSGDALTAYAVDRRSDRQKLPKMVKGELDWIAMKALEKDRPDATQQPALLSADVQRYLNDEQVEACPPSLTYRLQKYARKHKTAFAMTSMAAAMLLFGISATAWQAVRATLAETDATTQRNAVVVAERQARSEHNDARAANVQLQAAPARHASHALLPRSNLLQNAWEANNMGQVFHPNVPLFAGEKFEC